MAVNFIHSGDFLTLAAPYDRLSGQGALVGSIFGVATVDVLSTVSAEFGVEGVWDVTKLSTDVFAQGALVYWDNTNKRCTSTSSGNKLIGIAEVAAANPSATVRVRLNGAALS